MLSSNRSKSFVAPSPTHDHMEEYCGDIGTIDESVEVTGSPSTSTSTLKIKIPPPRVQFHHPDALRRQQSLPSAESDCSYGADGIPEWPSIDVTHPHTINIDGEDVELRRKSSQIPQQKPHEPNIDFELDVKVLINSGKCVLHTKEANAGEEKTSTGKFSFLMQFLLPSLTLILF